MKIQVGKTYNDRQGREWYIECQLKHALLGWPAGTFMASRIGEGSGYQTYKQDGSVARKSYLDDGLSDFDLVPNVVEKTGWIIVLTKGTDGATTPCVATGPSTRYGAGEVFTYQQAAAERLSQLKSSSPAAEYAICQVTWKEEE